MRKVAVGDVGEQIGLPELADIDHEEIVREFSPAAIAGFADGDIVIQHEQFTDPQQVKLYGQAIFNLGEVAKRLHDASVETAEEPGLVRDLQSFMAQTFSISSSMYDRTNGGLSVMVYPGAIEVDDTPIVLNRVPETVVEFGACLSSRSVIRDQLAFRTAGEGIFRYVPITRNHFTNQVLLNDYDRMLDGLSERMIERGLFIGREDGIARATDEIISAQDAAGAPSDIADLIICTGGQHTTEADLKRGAENAIKILKDDGLFVIRALARPAADEIGADQIADWAFESGFEQGDMYEYPAHTHFNLGGALVTGSSPIRDVKTLLLSKPH